MKRLKFLLPLVLLASCGLPEGVVFDETKPVRNRSWHWNDSLSFTANLEDPAYEYRLILTMRVTGAYRYANMYILLHTQGPDGSGVKQYPLMLADNTGRWLGKGVGDLISFELPLEQRYRIMKKGSYRFSIRQNMRDEQLLHVSDVGLRIEKGEKPY
ncbi:MAG: hypothetical protein RL160_361 [Bacteroidota bacterium]